jgi:hypothetical protein
MFRSMGATMFTNRIVLTLTIILILIVLARQAPIAEEGGRLAQGASTFKAKEAAFESAYCGTNVGTAVPAGSETESRKYYGDIAQAIGFPIQDPPASQAGGTNLVDVAGYLGYSSKPPAPPLTAKELQDTSPADLMGPAFAARLGGVSLSAGDVLVARFFAPKISDVSQASVTQAGWRKLVRLRAQPTSAASAHGIEYGILLFNFFAPLSSVDPFTGNDSVNTQSILVGNDPDKSLYWIDFGKTSEGATLSHQLNAFFDAGHIPASATTENGGAAAYFVPCACVSCHGGLRLDLSTTPPAPDNHFASALLDYLDTDHWQDRTVKGDDFEGLKAPVLFDPSTFGVILFLNDEIRRQNAAAQPDSVLRRASEHWLASHLAEGATPEPLFRRALSRTPSSRSWNQNDPTDAELLPKLNRSCFRCHGSVLFDVMDKEMVLAFRSSVHATLFPRDEIVDKRAAMPPDRSLSPDELSRLRELILKLK